MSLTDSTPANGAANLALVSIGASIKHKTTVGRRQPVSMAFGYGSFSQDRLAAEKGMVPNFFHSDDIFRYSFGEWHPLKPERMQRTLNLLNRVTEVDLRISERVAEAELHRVHDAAYIEAVRQLARVEEMSPRWTRQAEDLASEYGLYGDNPPFPDMFDVSRGYVGVVADAARTVRDGAKIAFGLGGGLHHARRNRASGFCIFSDGSLALAILRERFSRVAYIDIDLHHGDGVQSIWLDDPSVLTYSIHESGKTLYPGTGFVHETGRAGTSINVPLPAKTTGDVFLDAFRQTALPILDRYRPQAIALQMGTDAHAMDPLGHLQVLSQDWLAAVAEVYQLGLPTVVTGGGGYHLGTVPRMWTAALLTLSGIEVPDEIPADLAQSWGTPTFLDPESSRPATYGADEVNDVVREVITTVLPQVPRE